MTNQTSITSDFDFLKVAFSDTVLITTTAVSDPDFQFPVDPFGGFGFGEQGILPINHNLGTIPLVRAWIDPLKNGVWHGSNTTFYPPYSAFISTIEPNLLTLVGPNTLKLCVNALGGHQSNIPVYYRIYSLSDVGVDSDSLIDKIFAKSPAGYSQSVGGASSSSDPKEEVFPVPHGQNEAIIWTMQFSVDQVDWYNDGNFIYGPPDTGSGPPGGPYARYYYQRAYMYGDNNNVYLVCEHNYASTTTFYFRWTLEYRI